MEPPTHSGYLHKKKTKGFGWDRRYFRLNDSKLSWFKTNTTGESQNFLPLKLVKKVERATFSKTPQPNQSTCGIKLEYNKGTYYLVAENPEDADEWVAVLQQGLKYLSETGWSFGSTLNPNDNLVRTRSFFSSFFSLLSSILHLCQCSLVHFVVHTCKCNVVQWVEM